jgi:hypothetical protein
MENGKWRTENGTGIRLLDNNQRTISTGNTGESSRGTEVGTYRLVHLD